MLGYCFHSNNKNSCFSTAKNTKKTKFYMSKDPLWIKPTKSLASELKLQWNSYYAVTYKNSL